MSLSRSIRNYVEVTKPKTVLLLVFTAFGAMMVGSKGSLSAVVTIPALIAVTLGSAGANALTCYLDRDIDAVMGRTRHRPLPSGRIASAKKALYYGLILVGLSLLLSYILSPLSSFLGLLGIVDNVIVYSKVLKRKNPINIIVGGFSGGIPALVGYAVATNTVDLKGIWMATLVVLWIPTHIWSLAIRYREDYERAGVPMLPVVIEERKAIRCVVSTSILLVTFSILLFFLNVFGLVYMVTAGLSGGLMLLMNIWLFLRPTRQNAWIVFKFSSPYLAIIFLAMVIDVLLS